MTLQGFAYAPDDHVLVTVDGAEVLAHDAQTESPKWRLALTQPVLALAFADAGALPGCERKNPWRDQAAGRFIIAVDAEGTLHAIDPVLGEATGTLGPFGKPLALVTGPGGLIALATEDKIHLWRAGERTEVAGRASALAFSHDGATLAVGAKDGSLRFLFVAGTTAPTETFCAVVHGGLTDVVQHASGTWIVAGKAGVFTVTDTGPRRLDSIPANATRLALDARGERLAVQISERAAVVYSWPRVGVEMRIEYIDRPICGMSFGSASWLGVSLDHGDGNKIDVVSSATHRTDTHPGRMHRSWALNVQGKATLLSEKEAEDIRRMKTPFHVPAPDKGRGGNGGRVGIGVAVSLALICLRLCAAGSRHSTYTPAPYYPSPAYTAATTRCDRECETARLQLLKEQCASSSCSRHAEGAVTAFAARDCKATRRALAEVATSDDDRRTAALSLLLASSGLVDVCGPVASKEGVLVRLTGPKLEAAPAETIPGNPTESDIPRTIWAASDGTIFVGTVNERRDSSYAYRRDKSGVWNKIATRRSRIPVQFWGKSATDLYIMDGDSLAHFDGQRTTEVAPPATEVYALGGVGDDVIVAGALLDDSSLVAGTKLFRRRKGSAEWEVEGTFGGLTVREIGSRDGTLWARADDNDLRPGTANHLLLRTANGKWTAKKWFGQGGKPTSEPLTAMWMGPNGEAFVATESDVYRSSGGGTTWSKLEGTPSSVTAQQSLWGRSATEVYFATSEGTSRYNGKTWSPTPGYRAGRGEHLEVVGGTPTEVFLLYTSSTSTGE